MATQQQGCPSPRTSAVQVAVATDRAYLPYAATAVLSCLEATAPRQVVVHLLHDRDVDAAALSRFAGMVTAAGGALHPLDVPAAVLGRLPAGAAAHGGAVSCARLLLPDLLPDLDRVVYLDADTLTLQSLGDLWEAPLEGLPLAAVRNVLAPEARARVRDLGVPDPRRYLNSGVLVMDLAHMRRHGTAAALLACLREKGDELVWVDQDALNVALRGAWAELHPRWNAQNSFWDWPEWSAEVLPEDDLAEARARPSVLHFEGPWLCKPWHYLCHHAYVEAYRDCLARTPWAGTPLTDRTAATRVIARLPARRRTAAFLRLVRLRARARRLRRR